MKTGDDSAGGQLAGLAGAGLYKVHAFPILVECQKTLSRVSEIVEMEEFVQIQQLN